MIAARGRVDAKALQLESLSPLSVLSRGYSLSTRAADGRLVRSIDQVTPGDELLTRLSDGELTSRIESIRPLSAAEPRSSSSEVRP